MNTKAMLLAISLAMTSAAAARAGDHAAHHDVGTAVVAGHEGCAECGEPKKGLLYKGKKRIHEFRRQWRQSNRWPEPYNGMAQCSVQRILDAQTAKGWMAATTLFEHHFDSENQELTMAGQRILSNIILRLPEDHRMVHVQTGATRDETAWRLEAVREKALALADGNSVPPILAVNSLPVRTPASQLNIETAKYVSSIPSPRLPADPGTGGASSGGSGAK